MTAAAATHPAEKTGILLLVHPSGHVIAIHRGEGQLGRHLILEGYEPIGAKGQAAAKLIRERAS